jgi:hypothetical protein
MLAHTHRKLAKTTDAITLTYRSSGRNRSSIHTDWGKKLRMIVSMFFGMLPTGKVSKENGGQSGGAHLVEGLCVEVVGIKSEITVYALIQSPKGVCLSDLIVVK